MKCFWKNYHYVAWYISFGNSRCIGWHIDEIRRIYLRVHVDTMKNTWVT
jgi:hypothetical protein